MTRFHERSLGFGSGVNDPWGRPRPRLTLGRMLRFPDGKVWIVTYVSETAATVYPLTPHTRVIRVPHRLDFRRKVEKEVNETGDPSNISVNSMLPTVALADLNELEFSRLYRYVEQGIVDIHSLDKE